MKLGRRIITGNDQHGRSHAVAVDPARMNGITAELWRSDGGAAPQRVGISPCLEPPEGGSALRFFRVMPESHVVAMAADEVEKLYALHFAQMGAAHCRPDTNRHAGMHRTATLDYVVLLEGNVTLLLDDDEIALQPFDVVVQCATNHAWVNHGDTPALLLAVLIDGRASGRRDGVVD